MIDLFGRHVDLTTPAGLKRQLRDRILREPVYAAESRRGWETWSILISS
jgi:hypothetical protein